MAQNGFMLYHCLYHNLKSSRDTFLEAIFRQPSLEVQIDSDINQLNAKTPEVGVGEGLQGAWKERQSFDRIWWAFHRFHAEMQDFMREERDAMVAASGFFSG
jgi:hypothetical protein